MTALERAIQSLRSAIPTLYTVVLFGSQADGTARPNSDLDLAILYDGAALREPARRAIEQGTAAAINQDVHLIDLRTTSDVMRFEIFTKGRFVLDLLPDKRDLFETEALADYARLNDRRSSMIEDFFRKGASGNR